MNADLHERKIGVMQTIGRSIAFFMGSFALLNILGQYRIEGFNANCWWIDFGSINPTIANILVGMVSVLLLVFTVSPEMPRRLRGIMDGLLFFLLVVCIYNAWTFWSLVKNETISSGFPIPFSLLVALGILIILFTSGDKRPRRGHLKRVGIFWLTFGFCMIIFPLGQMFCFGTTDYRRPAEAIVVFGAGVKVDGTMSNALRDRTVTGCDLYLAGYASKIIFSGGPGPGAVHETDAMKKKAIEKGIPEEDIIIDAEGLSTKKTVENTAKIFRDQSVRHVIAVSHFYHLPRIKMTYQRSGYEVLTVPAEEQQMLLRLPMYMAREIAALWVYYLRPLAPAI